MIIYLLDFISKLIDVQVLIILYCLTPIAFRHLPIQWWGSVLFKYLFVIAIYLLTYKVLTMNAFFAIVFLLCTWPTACNIELLLLSYMKHKYVFYRTCYLIEINSPSCQYCP